MLESKSKDKQVPNRDIFEIIHNRISIRKFLDKEIPIEAVEGILEARIRAPFAAQLYSLFILEIQQKSKKYKS